MNAQFSLVGVRKTYERRLVLDIDELTIRKQRLHVVTGPNGSGKSTLLNILAFLLRPDSGEVLFDHHPVNWRGSELRNLRTRVTLLHQNPLLFAGTVHYNVAYGLHLRRLGREAIRSRVAEALAMVDLATFATRSVKQLSGGERRRVALARALALRPDVLLLDEPMANVDATTARELERSIAGLPQGGTTVVMATHHVHHADNLPGNVIALEDGRLDSRNCAF